MTTANAQPAPSLTHRTTSGAAWGMAGALVNQVAGLVVQTALTYLLTRAEYGTYGKAFSLLTFAMLLQQVGFTEILLRRRNRLHLWATPAFWFSITLGVAGSVLMAAAAAPVGRLYEDPLLATLVLLASPLPLVRSFNAIPAAALSEQMRFRAHYSLMVAWGLAASLLTLALALLGLGAKSFILAFLIADPIYACALWLTARPRVRAGVRPRRWRFLARDLAFVFGSNAARWARASTDPLILGLFATRDVVGLYFFGFSMVIQIVRVVTLNLAGVLLPALNRLSDDPPRQVAAFLRAARVLMLIGAPLCVGLAASGTLFVRVFLNAEKWRDLPPVLGVLGLGVVFRLLDEPVQSLISAQGRFRLGFRLSVISAVAYIALCAAGSSTGVAINTALAAATYYAIAGPVLLAIAVRPGGGTPAQALRVFGVPFLLSVVAIGPWYFLEPLVPGQGRWRDAGALAGLIVASAATYAGLLVLLRPAGFSELLHRAGAVAPGPAGRALRTLAARAGA